MCILWGGGGVVEELLKTCVRHIVAQFAGWLGVGALMYIAPNPLQPHMWQLPPGLH